MVLLLLQKSECVHMTNKTFTVGGRSILNGVAKVRFANGSAKARSKVLERSGHTDIQLFDLPQAMTKDEIREYVTKVLAA